MKRKVVRLLAALGLVLSSGARQANAQIDTGFYEVWQDGSVTGYVFSEYTSSTSSREHWVCLSSFARPTSTLTIVPSRAEPWFVDPSGPSESWASLVRPDILSISDEHDIDSPAAMEDAIALAADDAAADETEGPGALVREISQCKRCSRKDVVNGTGEYEVAGYVLVAPGDREGTGWTEHWILFGNYAYPSPANGVIMRLRPLPFRATGGFGPLLRAVAEENDVWRYIRVRMDASAAPPALLDPAPFGVNGDPPPSANDAGCALTPEGRAGAHDLPVVLLAGTLAIGARMRRRNKTAGRGG